ncbi:MAG: hypothetical protein L3J12_03885 [Spirochaetales bacterium]|nr:hypothetical protein [Spirochaetales bacterium]
MKGSILLPVVQILLIIIISTLVCVGVYLYMFTNSYSPEYSLTIGLFISRIPGIMLNIFPIVVLMSIILSLVNTLKTPANRGLAALFTLIAGGLLYYTGYTGLYQLDKISDSRPISPVNHLYTDRINPLKDSKLYIKEVNGTILAIESENSREKPDLSIYQSAEYNSDFRELHTKQGYIVSIIPENPNFSDHFTPPKLLERLLEDLLIFNDSIKNIFEKSRWLFLITVLSQIAFAVGCWTIIRLSRWPFLNGLLAVGVLRLFPAYYRLSYSEITQKAISFLRSSSAVDLAPAALLLAAAVLLFLWDILFGTKRAVSRKNG